MNSQKGFTLMELLIAVAIISILALVLFPAVASARSAANDTAAEAYARNVTQYAASWLLTDHRRRIDGLATDCTDVMYRAEGGPAGLPRSVRSCQVITDLSTSRITVEVVSDSGQTYRKHQ